MIDFKTFVETFTDVQRDMVSDHGSSPVCHMLHKDLDLEQTQAENAEEVAERAQEELGISVEADDIDLTEEHAELHRLLDRGVNEMLMVGLAPDQIAAAFFAIGRRYGLREAANALSTTDDEADLGEWLQGFGGEGQDDGPEAK